MASATDTSAPRRATLAATWVTRALGAALLAAVAWQAILVVATPPRQYAALGFWLLVGSSLPILIPCWIGGALLLRGRPGGFRYLYVAAALVIAGEMAILMPSASGVLGPPRYSGVWRSCLPVLALVILPVLAHRAILHFLPAVPTKPWRLLAGPLCLLLALLPLRGLCSSAREQVEQQAGGPVWRGIEAYEAGRHDEAVEA